MAKVFPLADTLDFKVDPNVYRMTVGVVELVCGIMLAMIPGSSWSHSLQHMLPACFYIVNTAL